jgi:hypothetical protein
MKQTSPLLTELTHLIFFPQVNPWLKPNPYTRRPGSELLTSSTFDLMDWLYFDSIAAGGTESIPVPWDYWTPACSPGIHYGRMWVEFIPFPLLQYVWISPASLNQDNQYLYIFC